MEENNLYSSYRFVSGAMNLLCSSLTHIVYLLTAPLLVFLARDFGLDNATAGYASTVHILSLIHIFSAFSAEESMCALYFSSLRTCLLYTSRCV